MPASLTDRPPLLCGDCFKTPENAGIAVRLSLFIGIDKECKIYHLEYHDYR
jgi:hypothetical protein